MTRILFYLDGYPHDQWIAGLKAADPAVEVCSYPDWGSPDDGPSYAYVWQPPTGLLKNYPNITAIFSLGAGVDHLTRDPDLPDVPIIRMSDNGLREAMAEYVLMATLMMHRRMPQSIAQQKTATWERFFSAPASAATVGILGFGALGKAAYQALKPLGYQLRAWSRTPKERLEGLTHFDGMENLEAFLTGSDIIIGLLPETPETRGLLNRNRLKLLNPFGSVINAGRGGLVVLEDLIDLLNEGHLGGAILDVFDKEPLDPNHPAWHTDRLLITPHVAAITRPESAGAYVIDMITQLEAGNPVPTILDRSRGY